MPPPHTHTLLLCEFNAFIDLPHFYYNIINELNLKKKKKASSSKSEWRYLSRRSEEKKGFSNLSSGYQRSNDNSSLYLAFSTIFCGDFDLRMLRLQFGATLSRLKVRENVSKWKELETKWRKHKRNPWKNEQKRMVTKKEGTTDWNEWERSKGGVKREEDKELREKKKKE